MAVHVVQLGSPRQPRRGPAHRDRPPTPAGRAQGGALVAGFLRRLAPELSPSAALVKEALHASDDKVLREPPFRWRAFWRGHRRCGVALATLLVLGSSGAAPVVGADGESAQVLGWRSRARSIDEALHAGEWKKARKRSEGLLGEMCDSIVGGPGTEAFLGVVLTYLALAERGGGLERDAAWHWSVAKQLFPEAAALDLSSFGEVGASLAAEPEREEAPDANEVAEKALDRQVRAKVKPWPREVEPPRSRRKAPPKYPAAQKGRAPTLTRVVVKAVIGRDGLPRDPVILEFGGPKTFVLSTLEAMREWTFEPARLDGEPVAVWYVLTSTYRY